MVVNEPQHDTDMKVLLNSAVLPRNRTTLQDVNGAIDNIVNPPNVGPFIAKAADSAPGHEQSRSGLCHTRRSHI
jgi:hypothetical protein